MLIILLIICKIFTGSKNNPEDFKHEIDELNKQMGKLKEDNSKLHEKILYDKNPQLMLNINESIKSSDPELQIKNVYIIDKKLKHYEELVNNFVFKKELYYLTYRKRGKYTTVENFKRIYKKYIKSNKISISGVTKRMYARDI